MTPRNTWISGRGWRAGAVGAALASMLLLASARADSDFVLGAAGCPMAHCDPSLSDLAEAPVPAPPVSVAWRGGGAGSALGLGCASNGAVAACTFTGTDAESLVVFDPEGRRLWGNRFVGPAAAWSAPMVAADGGVIAADALNVTRFSRDGHVLWRSRVPAGIPLSPVLTGSGIVVAATWNGPVIAYDARTGATVGALWLGRDVFGISFFHSKNTASVAGDRVYVVAERRGSNPSREGRLYAIDVTAAGLREAWHFRFGASSGGSPTVLGDVVFFDGDRPSAGADAPFAPTVFAVQDTGPAPALLWARPVPSRTSVVASFAVDPRGGVWLYGVGDDHLVRLDTLTGEEVERVSVDALAGLPERHVPSSAMTVGGSAEAPVLLVGAEAKPVGRHLVIAVDLAARALLWKIELDRSPSPSAGVVRGQFAIVSAAGSPRVIFSTARAGVLAVGSVGP